MKVSAMMALLIVKLIVMAVTLVVIGGAWETSFQRRGEAHTYRCRILSYPDSNPNIIWSLLMLGRKVKIASCHLSSRCSLYFPNDFSVSISGAKEIISELTIHSHNDSMKTLECHDSWRFVTRWTITIFTMPSKVTCMAPYVVDDYIKVICEGDSKAYPAPTCDFRYEPSEPLLNKTVTFDSFGTRSTGSCVLFARPTSRISFPKTEYRFSVNMIPDIQDENKRDANIVRSDLSSAITVEVLYLTANGQRGSIVVDDGQEVEFKCRAISNQPYTLTLKNDFRFIKSQYSGTLYHRRRFYQHLSRDLEYPYSCQAESSYKEHEILGDNIKVHLRGPLRLKYGNGTKYIASRSSLHYEITGLPAPMINLSRLISAEGFDSTQWRDSSDFTISSSEIPGRNSYQLTLTPSESYSWPYLYIPDTKYMLIVSNGIEPALWISFMIHGQSTATYTTTFPWKWTSTRSERQESYQYTNSRSTLWSLGPVFGVLIALATVLFIIIHSCRKRKATAREQDHQGVAAERSRASSPATSGAPLISLAFLAHEHNSSNGSSPRNQQPSSRSVTSTNDQRGIGHGDAPPSYEFAALTPNDMSSGGMDTNAQFEPRPISQQNAVQPPPYDSVSKFEEPPPPYPGNYM